ncbi:hypothetical protein M0R45_008168 [Rubus argutus]|uniref:Uncharacterized protein n=1 Tax=Rubus argutus TaxID=59490 RepID=A0AAW1Y1Z7_RUBAR
MVRVGLGKAEHGLYAVLDGGVEAQWRRNDGDGAAGLVAAWAEMASWFVVLGGDCRRQRRMVSLQVAQIRYGGEGQRRSGCDR